MGEEKVVMSWWKNMDVYRQNTLQGNLEGLDLIFFSDNHYREFSINV